MFNPSDKTLAGPKPVPIQSPAGDDSENRTKPRYSFAASAEVYELKTQTRVTGRCSDLSMSGCYIDTLAPFSMGSAVRVRIEFNALEFQATAVVVYVHPSMGMGISFTIIGPEQNTVLIQWIAKLSGAQPSLPALIAPEPLTEVQESDAALRLVLKDLITLLAGKKILTEKEASEFQLQMLR